MITVLQLISRLRDFDPELPVVVSGFDECGFADLSRISEVQIAPVAPKSHGPDYEAADDQRALFTGPPIRAVLLDF